MPADGSEQTPNAFRLAAARFVAQEPTILEASRAFKAYLRSLLPMVKKVSAEIHDMADAVLDAAAYEAVTSIQRGQRKAIWRTPNHQTESVRDRLISSGDKLTLMDFPMRSGRRLADADGAEVQSDAEAYLSTANDALMKSQWLRRIATAVGDKIVRDVLTLADLERMRV